jgi:hypothetical protein
MAIIPDILNSWRDPKGLIRAKTAIPREDRALATLMGAAGLIFVAGWPEMARKAALDSSVPMDARIGANLMALIFILPLFLYLFAGLTHLVARAVGGKGSGFGARMALFQALLSSTPLFLLNGLARGFLPQGPGTVAVGAVALAGFLWLWLTMLVTVERGEAHV